MRGRGRDGLTPQPPRSSLPPLTSVASPHTLVPTVVAVSGHADRDQLACLTFEKLAAVIGSLGTLLSDNIGRNASSTRDSKQRPPMSGHTFDTSKIVQYTGQCTLDTTEEHWLCPGSWTKQFRNLMLSCMIPHCHWNHFALMCCSQAVVIPWEKKIEKPSNSGPGWQSAFQLDVQDDGIDIPYARRQSWPEFVRWLASSFNLRDLFDLQHEKFKMMSQNPGERVHAYNIRWNLERDLVDVLAVAELYPAGSVHEQELENTYFRSLVGPLSSKLYDLRTIQGTLRQVMGNAQDTVSGGSLSLGLQIL